MQQWSAKQNVELDLEGSCGFGRDCVGITTQNNYPSYQWFDEDYNQSDSNGDVFTPADAYHKHPCVAVLGRGEEAEAQLYDWLKWFDDNNFNVVVTENPVPKGLVKVELVFFNYFNVRMVKA